MARDYITVPVGLIEHADAAADHMEAHGYRVKVEHAEIGYPYTPTLHCKRDSTTLLIEVDEKIRIEKLGDWSRFGRSVNRDTRVVLVLPAESERTGDDEAALREMGVGLLLSDGRRAVEAIPARDLAVNVELPDIHLLHKKMQRLLGPVYEKFDRSEWREGFEDACQALEVEARRYLKEGMNSGRITLIRQSGRPSRISVSDVDRMPIGPLAGAFALIATPNHADSVIGKVLADINTDRVGVVHHRRRAATEQRLRRNVGRHMWAVIAALKELLSLK